jgi:hypothetical protein
MNCGSTFPALLWTLLLATWAGQACTTLAEDRAAWMREARWGVMTHYLADWRARVDKTEMSVEAWNELVDHFDVEGLAGQLESVGAGYHILTIGQNSGYYACPNPTYDRLTGIQPSKCSRRDLIGDMARALHKRGIRLIAYLPSGAPGRDAAARAALQAEGAGQRNRDFQLKWEQVIRDWSLRWGTNISGWWFDGCYWPNAMYRSAEPPNFESFAAAARAGNPRSALAFNPGVVDRLISITPHEDYTAGEINDLDRLMIRRLVDGKVDGAQPHVLSFLGAAWGMGAARFSTETVVAHSRKTAALGGMITWDVPVQAKGLVPREFLDQLSAVGQALKPPAQSERPKTP